MDNVITKIQKNENIFYFLKKSPFHFKCLIFSLFLTVLIDFSYGVGGLFGFFPLFGIIAIIAAAVTTYSSYSLLIIKNNYSPYWALMSLLIHCFSFIPIFSLLNLDFLNAIALSIILAGLSLGFIFLIYESSFIREQYSFLDGEETGKPIIPIITDKYKW